MLGTYGDRFYLCTVIFSHFGTYGGRFYLCTVVFSLF